MCVWCGCFCPCVCVYECVGVGACVCVCVCLCVIDGTDEVGEHKNAEIARYLAEHGASGTMCV